MGQRTGAFLRGATRGFTRGTAAVLSVVVLVATGYGWATYRDLAGRVVTSDVVDPGAPEGADGSFTALLVGLDSRTDANGGPLPPQVLAQLRAGEDEGQLHTDTIVLLHVPAGPDAAAVAVSIPRDSFVEIAGDRGQHKINSAYRRGMQDAEEGLAAQGVAGAERERRAREAGRRTLVATVADLTGVRIDHFAEVNLAGFVEITEAVGGVPVCLRAPVREERSGVDLPGGYQRIAGADALAFVRQRHGLPDGDLSRIARQQAFMAGLARTLLSTGTLTDPGRTGRLVDAVTRYVVLDRGWDLDRLVAQLGRISRDDLTFRTIPTGAPDLQTPVDGIAVEVDPAQVRRFVSRAVAGLPEPSVRAAPAGPGLAQAAGPAPRPAPPRITASGVTCVD